MQMLDIKYAAFSAIMGKVNLVPVFGTTFPTFFPILLIALCALNYFNVYNLVLTKIGLSGFEFSEHFTDGKIEQGKNIILERTFFLIGLILRFRFAR